MDETPVNPQVERLAPLVGKWSLEVAFRGAPAGDSGARTSFEWMSGERFLIQHWEVPHPGAPDGLAVIGWDERRATLLQHYFDSRGVARVYEMSFEGGVWKLSRTAPDFSELNFSQRFEGALSDDGRTIEGRWEIARDGSSWEHDFDLTYRKVA